MQINTFVFCLKLANSANGAIKLNIVKLSFVKLC